MNEMYENNVASSTSTKEKCPYCGGVIEAGSRFCGYCGGKIERPAHVVENPPYQTPTYSQGQKMKAPFGIGAMICSIIGMGLLLLFFIIGNDNEDLYPFFVMMSITGLAISIVGMALGIVGWNKIKGNFSAYSGTSRLTVAKILGIIGAVIWSLIVTMAISMLVVDGSLEGLFFL
ncbi:MAG: hypothetical protein IKW82_06255 [Bacteroidales bacterium]|nr:hypothetical protein [Bacteroidales bacterium]